MASATTSGPAKDPGRSGGARFLAMLSLPAMIAVMVGFLGAWSSLGGTTDPDMWWHLKVGEMIASTGELPRTDTLSHTTTGQPWIPHQWLAQLGFFLLWDAGGFGLLLAALCLVAAALPALVYWLCADSSGNHKVALLGGLIGWLFASVSLSVRPLLLGNLFLVLELIIIHLGRTRDRRWFWALPPLFALWVNCHGSFAFGLVLLAIHWTAAHLEFSLGLVESRRWPAEERRALLAASALACCALLLNPVGFELALYPLDVFFAQSDNTRIIAEWRPLTIRDLPGQALLAVALAIVAAVVLRRKSIRLLELLLLALGAYMALAHIRFAFLFGLLAAPALCRLLADSYPGYNPKHNFPLLNAGFMATALAVLALNFPSAEEFRENVERRYPTAAIEYIRAEGLSGPMLNNYVWGGYLIWALPEQKVFIDGRADLFDWSGVLKRYSEWERIGEDPRKLLDDYCIDYCLLASDAAIVRVLDLLPDWERRHEDDLAVVFVRKPAPPVSTTISNE